MANFASRWEKAEQKLDKVTDAIGKPIEQKIRRTIIALWLHNLPTNGSCEGHTNWGWGAKPWVDIESPPPQYKWEGEAIFQKKTLAKMNAVLKDISAGPQFNDGIYETYQNKRYDWLKTHSQQKTRKYLEWQDKNHRLLIKVRELILEFERNRSHASCRIFITAHNRLSIIDKDSSKDEDLVHTKRQPASTQKKLAQRLRKRQKLMDQFTEFLIQKIK